MIILSRSNLIPICKNCSLLQTSYATITPLVKRKSLLHRENKTSKIVTNHALGKQYDKTCLYLNYSWIRDWQTLLLQDTPDLVRWVKVWAVLGPQMQWNMQLLLDVWHGVERSCNQGVAATDATDEWRTNYCTTSMCAVQSGILWAPFIQLLTVCSNSTSKLRVLTIFIEFTCDLFFSSFGFAS